ncbi:hypothetical protein BDEG_24506 [Batrachochytrium dendrobatidis JEL423]|uniref:GATA-type domain-containing protein n=1 Tax=Batrachochytrium dendrobatidis (strain JEL423) TaxID=403673 RepID=A0A177WLY5_BATDL|nr:hypothetical protein BDEG_24506 [Batrachochytrium dendrobatidis JEL423]
MKKCNFVNSKQNWLSMASTVKRSARTVAHAVRSSSGLNVACSSASTLAAISAAANAASANSARVLADCSHSAGSTTSNAMVRSCTNTTGAGKGTSHGFSNLQQGVAGLSAAVASIAASDRKETVDADPLPLQMPPLPSILVSNGSSVYALTASASASTTRPAKRSSTPRHCKQQPLIELSAATNTMGMTGLKLSASTRSSHRLAALASFRGEYSTSQSIESNDSTHVTTGRVLGKRLRSSSIDVSSSLDRLASHLENPVCSVVSSDLSGSTAFPRKTAKLDSSIFANTLTTQRPSLPKQALARSITNKELKFTKNSTLHKASKSNHLALNLETSSVDSQPICATTTTGLKRICQYCGTDSTPMWRHGPKENDPLCNKCGVKWKRGRILTPGFYPKQKQISSEKLAALNLNCQLENVAMLAAMNGKSCIKTTGNMKQKKSTTLKHSIPSCTKSNITHEPQQTPSSCSTFGNQTSFHSAVFKRGPLTSTSLGLRTGSTPDRWLAPIHRVGFASPKTTLESNWKHTTKETTDLPFLLDHADLTDISTSDTCNENLSTSPTLTDMDTPVRSKSTLSHSDMEIDIMGTLSDTSIEESTCTPLLIQKKKSMVNVYGCARLMPIKGILTHRRPYTPPVSSDPLYINMNALVQPLPSTSTLQTVNPTGFKFPLLSPPLISSTTDVTKRTLYLQHRLETSTVPQVAMLMDVLTTSPAGGSVGISHALLCGRDVEVDVRDLDRVTWARVCRVFGDLSM